MTLDRRSLIGAGFGLGAVATAAHAAERRPAQQPNAKPNASELSGSLVANDDRDQTAALGFANAMSDLPQNSTKGGMLYVFSLP